MTQKKAASAAPSDSLLGYVLEKAIDSLRAAEGRAAGLKFNKLVFAVQRELAKSKTRKFHFTVPYRWYLYGAVVDDFALRNLVEFDHPEEELRTNVRWVGGARRSLPRGYEGLADEIEVVCQSFVKEYHGREGLGPMLRAHYQFAPLEFQRKFLEWSLGARDTIDGYAADVPEIHLKLLRGVVESFPSNLEPRLSPPLERLILYVEPLLHGRAPGDLKMLDLCWGAMWDFWSTFCLFLSLKYNEGLSQQRLASFRNRAETDLVAYKRRLNAFLEQQYLKEQPGAPGASPSAERIRTFVFSEVMRELDGDA